jgi:hypothetical protein
MTALFSITGCTKNRIVELKKDLLFSIPIGNEEEEIGILMESNGRFVGPSDVIFRNGFIFAVDSVNQKILKITTPGDIILIIADGTASEDSQEEDAVLRTKQKKYHDFNQIGRIAVDHENNIYVEDVFLQKKEVESVIDIFSIDDELVIGEKEYEESYMSYILKFDRLGNFIHKIGKNGIDGDPFYYVYKMGLEKNGNLVVLTGDEDWNSWTYYRFDPETEKMEKNQITVDEFQNISDTEDHAYFVMDIIPTGTPHEIVYWLSHYTTSQDTKNVRKEEDLWGEEIEIEDYDRLKRLREEEEKQSEIQPIRDLLYYDLIFYNLDSRLTGETHRWETGFGAEVETTEEFLGIDGGSNCFYWKYIDRNKSVITILRPDGTFVTKRSFIFEDDGLWMNVHVAPDGSISAVKIDRREVHFFRWRSDKLIGDKDEKLTLREFILDKVEEFKNANR